MSNINVYDLQNKELVKAFENKDNNKLLEIASESIFLIPVKNKNNINKIAFESMMDSNKNLFIPLFINMADIETNPMIKGKQVLIAHFGMIEVLLSSHPELYGICINPCTMDCKIDREEINKIIKMYHYSENKPDFEPDFYQKEILTMADLKLKTPTARAEVILSLVDYLKSTPIKKMYLIVKPVGNKLHYKFIADYSPTNQSYIDEFTFKTEKLLNENETFEIVSTKNKINEKLTRFMEPIFQKK